MSNENADGSSPSIARRKRRRHRSHRKGSGGPGLGHTVEVKIVDMGTRGWGIAEIGGRQVHVWGTFPGDRVKARVVSRRGGRIEAEVLELQSRGLRRVLAPCSHFSICGGCLWQDIAYEDQLAMKQRMVKACLKDAGLTDIEVEDTLASPQEYQYRNKVEYAFSRDAGGGLVTGLHVSGRKHKRQEAKRQGVRERLSVRLAGSPPVFQVSECELLPDDLGAAAVRAGRRLAGVETLAYDPESRTGTVRSIVVRRSHADGQILANLVTGEEETDSGGQVAEALKDEFLPIAGVVRSWNPKRSRQAVPEKQIIEAGVDRIVEKISGLEIEVSSTSFLQVNTPQAENLYQAALERAALTPESRVLDLFSGTGALSLLAARQASDVTGIEVREEAVEDSRRNAERNGLSNVRFIAGDVRDVLAGELSGETFDMVLTNPPRAGITRRAIDAICKMAPPAIVYVSCDAETLARDLALFAASGYVAGAVAPIDMFPHTPHCEMVVRLDQNE